MRVTLPILCFLAISVRVTPAPGAEGDYSDYDDLTEEVLACEEAVSILARCCPGFDPHAVQCVDHRYRRTSSCDGSVHEGHDHPMLRSDQSECVRGSSCTDLVRTNTCGRVARGYTLDLSGSGNSDIPAFLPGACL